MERNKKSLGEFLQRVVGEYLEKTNVSLNGLALRSQVSFNTLKTITKEGKAPSMEIAIKILMAISGKTKISEVIHILDEETNEFFKKIYNLGEGEEEKKFIASDLLEYFADPDYFVILNYAYTHSGIKKEKIFKRFGEFGSEKLNELLEKGLLQEDDEGRISGRCEGEKKSFSISDPKILKERVKLFLNYYRPEMVPEGLNWISVQYECLNENAIEALISLEKEHYKKKKEIYNNPLNMGDRLFFLCSFGDQLK